MKSTIGRGETLSKSRMNEVRSINNKLFDGKQSLTDLTWIKTEYKKIISFITDDKLYKPSTQLLKIFALVTVLRFIGETKLADKLSAIATEKQKKLIKTVYDKNEKDTRHLNIEYAEVIKHRDELEIKRNNSIDDSYNFLVMACYTYIKPIRYNFHDVKIGIDKLKEHNYIYKTKKTNDKYNMYLKAYKKHDEITITLTKKLSDYIDESVKKFPRSFVFADDTGNREMSYKTFTGLFKRNFGVGVDAIRSIAITEFFKTNPSNQMKEHVAKLIQSSVEVMNRFYNKINDKQDIKKGDETQEVI